MTTIQIKAYLNNSIRRFTVNTDTTFESFQQQIKKLYPEEVSSFTFHYVDDEEDLVTFSSEHEWQSALAGHVESKAKLLRVKVRPNVEQRQPRGQFHGRGPFGFANRGPCGFAQRCAPKSADHGNSDHEIEKLIQHVGPILKSLFGIEVEIEREEPQKTEEKKEEVPAVEKVEEKQEEEIEEIIIPDDEEPVVQQVEEPVEAVQEPVVEEKKPEVPFAAELETLANMGFTNEKLNTHLLSNFNGDLIRVVNALVQLSTGSQ